MVRIDRQVQGRGLEARPSENPWLRWTLITAGSLSVGLGVIGIFVPLLPTTPFLLLAAFCYVRSSDRCYTHLMTNRWLGKYIRNYREGRGTPLHVKLITIIALWLTIGYSALVATELLWVRLLLLGVAVGVTIHLVWIPTLKR